MKGASRHAASFFQKLAMPFLGRASPCITGSSSLKAATTVTRGFNWSFQSHRNVFTIQGIFTQIPIDLFFAFQLLKNDGVTQNEPIDFVPTSCVACTRMRAKEVNVLLCAMTWNKSRAPYKMILQYSNNQGTVWSRRYYVLLWRCWKTMCCYEFECFDL